jgi:Fe2+ transport system protein FeoA
VRCNSLAAFGLVPGCEIRVIQRYPSSVIGVGETVLALEPDVAGEIVVRLRETAPVS